MTCEQFRVFVMIDPSILPAKTVAEVSMHALTCPTCEEWNDDLVRKAAMEGLVLTAEEEAECKELARQAFKAHTGQEAPE